MIPVANIYWLLSYAWDRLDEDELRSVQAEDPATLADLFARLLLSETERLLRRGLDREYVERRAVLAGLRGRLEVTPTLRRNLLPQARTACVFDELDHDVPQNRIIKSTLNHLSRIPDLDGELRDALIATRRRLGGVSDRPRVSPSACRAVRLHRNNRGYRFPMRLCELVWRHLLPSERPGEMTFRDFRRDRRAMDRLWERFLVRFYRVEQEAFRVRPRRLSWRQTAATDAASEAVLPRLSPDLVLSRPGRVIVADAKYYADPLLTHPSGKRLLRSGHLYQLYAYMRSHPASREEIEGMLLYAAPAGTFDYRYEIDGFPLRVAGIDLAQPLEAVRNRLLALLAEHAPCTLIGAGSRPVV